MRDHRQTLIGPSRLQAKSEKGRGVGIETNKNISCAICTLKFPEEGPVQYLNLSNVRCEACAAHGYRARAGSKRKRCMSGCAC